MKSISHTRSIGIVYTILLLFTFPTLYINLFLWGFTAGPADAGPWWWLAGGAGVILLVLPLLPLLPVIAGWVSVVGSVALFVGLIFARLHAESRVFSLLLPFLIMLMGVFLIWRTQGLKVLQVPKWRRSYVPIALALLPIGLFFFTFDAKLVFRLILNGPVF